MCPQLGLLQTSVSLFDLLLYFLYIQISLADLQSLLSELEGRNEGQAANIESLTATLMTKDEIINVRTPPIHRVKRSSLKEAHSSSGLEALSSDCI